MGILVDKHNTSLEIISGGDFWLYVDWLRLGFTSVICVLSGISLFSDNK